MGSGAKATARWAGEASTTGKSRGGGPRVADPPATVVAPLVWVFRAIAAVLLSALWIWRADADAFLSRLWEASRRDDAMRRRSADAAAAARATSPPRNSSAKSVSA